MALKRAADTTPFGQKIELYSSQMSRRAWRSSDAGVDASRTETAASADLGGSSKYSSEILEGRSGEGFRVNIDWAWVSRS